MGRKRAEWQRPPCCEGRRNSGSDRIRELTLQQAEPLTTLRSGLGTRPEALAETLRDQRGRRSPFRSSVLEGPAHVGQGRGLLRIRWRGTEPGGFGDGPLAGRGHGPAVAGCWDKDEFPLHLVDCAWAIDDDGIDEAVLRCNHVILGESYEGGHDSDLLLEAARAVVDALRAGPGPRTTQTRRA